MRAQRGIEFSERPGLEARGNCWLANSYYDASSTVCV